MSGTILVIEDDDDSRSVLLNVLADEGYRVIGARDGLEGLQAARVQHPNLILLDIHMPVMDGIAFKRHQARYSDIASIPVICVSAVHDAVRIAEDLGAVECVTKPVDFDRLVQLISAHSIP